MHPSAVSLAFNHIFRLISVCVCFSQVPRPEDSHLIISEKEVDSQDLHVNRMFSQHVFLLFVLWQEILFLHFFIRIISVSLDDIVPDVPGVLRVQLCAKVDLLHENKQKSS